jgi:Cu(I)/Ag(I) efflux system membrane fusion protein
MKRAGAAAAIVMAAIGGSAGFWAGRSDSLEGFLQRAPGIPIEERITGNADTDTRAILYYRHPDGEPAYSAGPARTADGRDFVPVRQGEDVAFGEDGLIAASDQAEAASGSGAGEGKVLYYRNPMGLADTSPVPKKDSMGMDYIPVYEAGQPGDSTVRVSAGKIQRTGVTTEKAVLGVVARSIDVPGTVTLDERLVSVVSPRVEAFVETVADVTTGDRIEAGDELMRVYSRDIAAAGAQFLLDLSSGVPEKAMSGSRLRLKNLGVPESAVRDMEATRAVPESIVVTAPFDGVILERSAIPGMMAKPGEILFKIADISRVWIMAEVPEYLVSEVAAGAKAVVRFRGLPGKELEGTVDQVYPEIREQTRTTRVRVELANPEGVLLANMYADVAIAGRQTAETVTVPDEAVIDTGERQSVFVDLGEGRFEPRDVRVGMRSGGRTEILEGISEGEAVVVSGNFLIDAESNLNAAFRAFEPEVTAP